MKRFILTIVLLFSCAIVEGAVTFDVITTLDDMIFYDDSAGTYTVRDYTTGDYFDDDSAVDDTIAFGWERGVWHTLTVNVGTQLGADSITVVWEYSSSYSGWTALAGVTDNTNTFQNAGSNTVVFDVPDGWYRKTTYAGSTARSGCYIRARITAVTNISEGGANATDRIQGGDYAIQINDADTRLSDIQTADDGAGWGMITTSGKFSQLSCNLRILSGGELYLRDHEMLQIGLLTQRRIIFMNSGAFFQLGMLDANGDYNEGVSVMYWNNGSISPYNTWLGTLNIYNSHFTKYTGSYSDPKIACNPITIINSILDTPLANTWFFTGQGTAKNFILDQKGSRWYNYSPSFPIDNLVFADVASMLAGYNNVVSNTEFEDRHIQLYTKNLYLRDSQIDDYSHQILAPGGFIKVQYTISLDIVDENGDAIATPNVQLVDSQGNIVFEGEWSSDFIATVWEEDKYIETDFNPFTITVTKPGYKTYTTTWDLIEKTTWVISLDKGDTLLVDSTFYDSTIY